MDAQDPCSNPRRPDLLKLTSLIAFIASAPLMLPSLDALSHVLRPWELQLGPLVSLDNTFFLRGMMLGVMFSALAMLFICLLKTAFGLLERRVVFSAAGVYVTGMSAVLFSVFIPSFPPLSFDIVSVFIGSAVALLCMAWIVQLDLRGYRCNLRALVILALAPTVVDGLVRIISPLAGSILLCGLLCYGTVGCLVGFIRTEDSHRALTVSGSNWWDVFGRLDVSFMDEAADFGTSWQRALLLVVTPLVMLLLMTMGMDAYHTLPGDEPLMVIGGLLAVICCIPLFVIHTNRRTMNFAYRLYLPLLVVIVFVVGNFVPAGLHQMSMTVGIYTVCFVYGILMCGTVVTMAGHMRSLRLPAASLLLVAAGIICLLGNTVIDAGSLDAYKFQALMVLLVITAVLLLSMSSGGLWTLVLDGVPATPGDDDVRTTATLEERCTAIAREYGLTPREAEILPFLGRGHGSAYIAENLVVAESTIRSHVKSIYRKIGVNSREELIELIDRSLR